MIIIVIVIICNNIVELNKMGVIVNSVNYIGDTHCGDGHGFCSTNSNGVSSFLDGLSYSLRRNLPRNCEISRCIQ